MTALLMGRVCVVTGASRGIGRGIALQLAAAGATVYITGRHTQTLRATATEVETRGGSCIPVVCDSSKESDIKSLFERVNKEQNGRLDIVVNNAFSAVQVRTSEPSFWETDTEIWDDVNNVGLR
uniref:Dehydrogenase/reductase (SDR family) member 1 n=1 Tax=Callorhinchus milii TaxID=7868 RepID=A0A4W3GCN3_CALMI